MEKYAIEMTGIVKTFSTLKANDQVSLQLREGEILALLGENGAGKTTLMNVLFGLYKPDSGVIRLHGKEVRITNPNIATQYGIGMVHQHFKLVESFSVVENVALGVENRRGPFLDLKSSAKRLEQLSKDFGLDVDPYATVRDISVGMQQRVEILKMLYRNAEILIFDEPTAVLTPMEIADLMRIMRNLADSGKSIIFISHKLSEIKIVADRCTVMRLGKTIGTVDVDSVNEMQLAEMMVGHELTMTVNRHDMKLGEPVLAVENLAVKSFRHAKALGVDGVSFAVRRGEVLGIAGIDGSGQSELVYAITGLTKTAGGRILLNGRDITHASIRSRIRSGLAHIPEDRQKLGLVLDYSVEENMVLELCDREPFSSHGILHRDAIRQYADGVAKNFDVRSMRGIDSFAKTLSGGNQQKVIVGREIELDPELLIAVQPTRGLDIMSIQYIHKRILEQRDKGKGILLVSLEMDEILHISDRIIVMNGGKIVGEVMAAETNENELGLMMLGKGKERENDEKGA